MDWLNDEMKEIEAERRQHRRFKNPYEGQTCVRFMTLISLLAMGIS